MKYQKRICCKEGNEWKKTERRTQGRTLGKRCCALFLCMMMLWMLPVDFSGISEVSAATVGFTGTADGVQYNFQGTSASCSLAIQKNVDNYIHDYTEDAPAPWVTKATTEKWNVTSISVISGITKVGDYAFAGLDQATTLSIPETVTEIGEKTFSGCTALKTVTFENSESAQLKKIGANAFAGTVIDKITFPNSLEEIATEAFAQNSSLKSVLLPGSIDSAKIGSNAFRNAPSTCKLQFYYDQCSNTSSVISESSRISQGTSYAWKGNASINNLYRLAADSITVRELGDTTPYMYLDSDIQKQPADGGCAYFMNYKENDTTTTLNKKTDTELYAKETYTVNMTYTENPGFQFVGWRDNSLGTTAVYLPETEHSTAYATTTIVRSELISKSVLQLTSVKDAGKYTAVFMPREYQFTLNTNGGDVLTSPPVYDKFTYFKGDYPNVSKYPKLLENEQVVNLITVGKVKQTSIPKPSRSGYTFQGWYTAAEDGTRLTDEEGTILENSATMAQVYGADLAVTDLVLYAHWAVNEYTVTYDTQGGTLLPKGTSSAVGIEYSDLTLNHILTEIKTAVKTGYLFKGWGTAADGTGKKITDETGKVAEDTTLKITDLTSDLAKEDISLFAQWQTKAFPIVFHGNGGTIAKDSTETEKTLTVEIGKTEKETIPVPYRTDGTKEYFFKGWSAGETVTDVEIDSATKALTVEKAAELTERGITELYAVWETPKVKLTFDENGGNPLSEDFNNVEGYKTAAGEAAKIMIPKLTNENRPTKTAYDFCGWATEKDAVKVKYESGKAYDFYQDTKLYAVWETQRYTLLFDNNFPEDSQYSSSQSVDPLANQEIGKAIDRVLPNIEAGPYNAVCKGYYFAGWNTQKDGTGTTYAIGSRPDDLEVTIGEEGNVSKLYAVWKPLQFRLSFQVKHDRNHTGYKGSAPATITRFSFISGKDEIQLGESYMDFSCSLDEFLGWSLKPETAEESDILFKADGTSKYSGEELYDLLMQDTTGNVKRISGIISADFYDVWDTDWYTVTFEKTPPAEGTVVGEMDPIYVCGNDVSGVEIPSAEKKMSCSGYALLGWSSTPGSKKIEFQANGTGKMTGAQALRVYKAQGGSETDPADRDISLYPVWVDAYKVHLTEATKKIQEGKEVFAVGDGTGGTASGPSGTKTIEVYDTQIITPSLGITAASSQGYRLIGWKQVDQDGKLTGDYVAEEPDLTDFVYDKALYGSELVLAACFEKKGYTYEMNAGENSRITLIKNGDTASAVVTEALQTRSVSYELGDSLEIKISELDPVSHMISSVCIQGGEEASSEDVVLLSRLTLQQNSTIQSDSTTGANIYTLDLEKLIKNSPMKDSWTEKGMTGSFILTVACDTQKTDSTYTVTASCSEHGTISPITKKAKTGTSVVVTATPDAGYCVTRFILKSNGTTQEKALKVYNSEPQTVTCTQATEVYAEFGWIPEIFTISMKDTIHGIVSVSTTEAAFGESVTVWAYPDDDYRVKAIYVNDELVSKTSPYTFTVTEDAQVYAVFEKGGTQYTITGSADSNGEISIDEETVEKGADLTVEITPDSGYIIRRLYVDGKSVTPVKTYTFENIRKDHTIYATFAKGSESYVIRGYAGSGGSISIGSVLVEEGEDLEVTISADRGYRISDVVVDEKSVGAVSSYSFTDVDADHTIEAYFTEINTNYSGQYGMVNDGEGISVTGSTFTDVNTGNWYYQGVRYVVERGMAIPVSKNYFGARQNATRAEVVYMLYQYEGAPAAWGYTAFGDVPSSAWYADAVAWASGNGIVSGQTATYFNPNGSVTREQLSAILYRYAQYKGVNTTNTGSYLTGVYSDNGSISTYARDAVNWSCNSGLLSGRTQTQLDPKGLTTKAELSVIMMRFCKSL